MGEETRPVEESPLSGETGPVTDEEIEEIAPITRDDLSLSRGYEEIEVEIDPLKQFLRSPEEPGGGMWKVLISDESQRDLESSLFPAYGELPVRYPAGWTLEHTFEREGLEIHRSMCSGRRKLSWKRDTESW